MKKRIVVACTLLLLLSSAGVTFAEKVGGVMLPDTVQVDGNTLVLNGAGMRTKVIINVYAGGLYLPKKTSNVKDIIEADVPMAIKLHFVRNVDKKSIIDAWNMGFGNSKAEGYNASRTKIDQFNDVFSSDVEKDGIYDIVYMPAEGITVSIDGEEKVTIPGLEFKQAVYAIWLGETPADPKLKKGMLD